MLKENTIFNSGYGELTILKLLGKGKSGYSYLTEHKGNKFVLKMMHDEPCTYYSFSDKKVNLELQAYSMLNDSGVRIPELYYSSLEDNYIVKEFIDGELAANVIASGKLSSGIIRQLIDTAELLEKKNINIDFFPNNFVIKSNELYYIDYETNPYSSEWSLRKWGIYYWANSEGFRKFLETGDGQYINESSESGIPIKEPFEKTIAKWFAD